MSPEKLGAVNIIIKIIVITVNVFFSDCQCSLFPKGALLTLSCGNTVMDRSLNAWSLCLYSALILGFEAFHML